MRAWWLAGISAALLSVLTPGLNAAPGTPPDMPAGGGGSGHTGAPVAGHVDLRHVDFDAERPVALDGEWAWFPGRLITAAAAAAAPTAGADGGTEEADASAAYLELPVSLDPEESVGVATLVLTAVLPGPERLYGLKLPYMASAHRVFVDGREIGETGSVTEPYRAQYLPQELFFTAGAGAVEIAIQVANSHHRRMRLNRVYLGAAPRVRHLTHTRMMRDALLLGSLALLAIYHLIVYFLHRRDRAFLFFAGIAGAAAVRVGITTERVLVRLWPAMPPELMMKLGYAPVFLLLPLIVLYLRELSPFDTLKRPAQAAKWLGLALVVVMLVTPVRVYDWIFQYGLVLILLCATYVLILLFRRPVFDYTRGSLVIAVGGTLILLTGISDYLREVGLIQAPELLSTGILAFLLLQAYFLAWRFRSAYRDKTNLVGEVQRLNRDLELRISERTRELAAANDRLERISRTDGLTGIANRRYFDEAYEREWQHTVRDGSPIAAILADIDYFKAYNDHSGHLEGDECLRRIAEVLEGAARRRTDLVARYGGEEFMILLPDAELETADVAAEDLRRRIEKLAIPHPASPVGPVVTVSFGVAVMRPTEAADPSSLLREADTALYQAKALGRNRVVSGPNVSAPIEHHEHSDA
ncbi:MAG: diguanylate cyclase [Spirochaetes bacterium]|jgi:diguanylate cyclase (GGDEF)-like protein|nr:diguanylate cyclase [Spirochaetota bacterium]